MGFYIAALIFSKAFFFVCYVMVVNFLKLKNLEMNHVKKIYLYKEGRK